MTAPLQEAGDLTESDKEKDFVDKINNLIDYLETKRLFFSSEEQKIIDNITDKFLKTWNNYKYKKDMKNEPKLQKENFFLYKELWNSTSKEIPELIGLLEKVFKNALGLK